MEPRVGNIVKFTDELDTPMHGMIVDIVGDTLIVEDNDGDLVEVTSEKILDVVSLTNFAVPAK